MKFDGDIFEAICERLADGESLRAICRDEGMPSKANVFRWLNSEPGASDQYMRARETQADSIFDEMLTIADDETKDHQHRRLQIDTRKWMAGKMRPKVYGDKLDVTSGGEKIQAIEMSFVRPGSEAEDG